MTAPKIILIIFALLLICAACVQWLELEQWQGWVIAFLAVGGGRLAWWGLVNGGKA